jgi:hypothetical protein
VVFLPKAYLLQKGTHSEVRAEFSVTEQVAALFFASITEKKMTQTSRTKFVMVSLAAIIR